VPDQGKELLHAHISTMRREIFKHGLDQIRLGFEIVVSALGAMAGAHSGVWVRSGWVPQHVARSILNDRRQRTDCSRADYIPISENASAPK